MSKIVLFKTLTPVYHWNAQSTAEDVVNQGSTSSSKTISILQVLSTKAVESKNKITIIADRVMD